MTTYTVTLDIPADAGIEQAGETVTVEVDEDEYVLWAAREAGVWLPADCQQGWCCTCAAKRLDGVLDHSDARRYYDVDAAADFVLPCRATPDSDCHLRAFQYEEMLDHRADHDLPPGNSKR
ncbi:2Fe-2S iron-sulfur cluster-binding protein [Halobacterium zhouii]|uniref:2Fe-2S iron-sulfur cluster-binding protein n=1 Tax=Halobacterium zhouii TaxID=2902624 RepID=UPI001E34BD2D|nr:2Fe-2S iron-sulfur cluster-binding protein [Halobacterium zhouii]